MLTIPRIQQKGIFERLIRAKNGALMRVRFEVVEIDGEYRGRMLAVEPVIELSTPVEENVHSRAQISGSISNKQVHAPVLLLACPSIVAKVGHTWTFDKSVVSPFSTLEFLGAFKIRAPSL